ncbi:MAG TPA: PDZ domain-containing protein, partial [Phycisphaerales bacterium]|nr:PDZ domain-containing protein [Phycisphaerales bacterium]
MRCTLALAAVIFNAGVAVDQPQQAPPVAPHQAKAKEPTRESLDAAWQAAFEKKDYDKAVEGLEALARFAPGDPIVQYNLACVQTQRGDIDGAERALRRCLELGFTDFPRMLAEPDLAPLREGVVFEALRQGWRELQDTGIDHRLDRFKRTLAVKNQTAEQRGYQIEKDADLRLAYVSGFSKEGHAETKVELARITDYWRRNVLPLDGDGNPPAAVVAQGPRPDPWVLVFLPNAPDFQSWAMTTLGARADRVGGLYDNWKQQLVARDLGPTLRHEFWHALHWRHMSRIGQVHPMWLQEGLCALIEDVDPVLEKGEVVGLEPVPSWRTNMSKRMVKTNLLPKLSALMSMDEKTYMGGRALGHYAASRSFFLWLAHGGGGGVAKPDPLAPPGTSPMAKPASKLREWYTSYIADFAADPSGKTTTERVLGKKLDALDKDFRTWLTSLPDVGEQNTPGLPTLPCDLQPVGGEGMVVIGTGTNDLLKNPLLPGDVIVAVDGHPVRDQTELARLLGSSAFKPGQRVTLKVRRDG